MPAARRRYRFRPRHRRHGTRASRRADQSRNLTRPFSQKTAVGLSTDFTDFTHGPGREASPRRCFHVTRGVKQQPLSSGFQSVQSVKSVDPTSVSRFRARSRNRVRAPIQGADHCETAPGFHPGLSPFAPLGPTCLRGSPVRAVRVHPDHPTHPVLRFLPLGCPTATGLKLETENFQLPSFTPSPPPPHQR